MAASSRPQPPAYHRSSSSRPAGTFLLRPTRLISCFGGFSCSGTSDGGGLAVNRLTSEQASPSPSWGALTCRRACGFSRLSSLSICRSALAASCSVRVPCRCSALVLLVISTLPLAGRVPRACSRAGEDFASNHPVFFSCQMSSTLCSNPPRSYPFQVFPQSHRVAGASFLPRRPCGFATRKVKFEWKSRRER